MAIKNNKLSILISLLFLVSCTTSVKLTSNVKPNDITDLLLFEPLSYIYLIESGNREYYDDSLSQKSKEMIKDISTNLFCQIPISGTILYGDTSINRKINDEIFNLIQTADDHDRISNLKITPEIDSVLESNGKRFGLFILHYGFTMTSKNYKRQVGIAAGIAILTLGRYTQIPIKASSSIFVMIVDTKEKNIAFYRDSNLQGEEPIDYSVLSKQFHNLFDDYFSK